jgi:hypothetical protein
MQKQGNGWYCQFLYHGKRHTISIGSVSKAEAQAKADQVQYLIKRLNQGLLELPAGIHIREFVQRDGRPCPQATSMPLATPLSLAEFRDRYLAANRESQDLVGKTVLIHETKRVRDKRTSRRMP